MIYGPYTVHAEAAQVEAQQSNVVYDMKGTTVTRSYFLCSAGLWQKVDLILYLQRNVCILALQGTHAVG
jgi:hypothetical protein